MHAKYHLQDDGHICSGSNVQRHFDGLVQDWGISSTLAMEILQSCTEAITLPFPLFLFCLLQAGF